MKRLILCVGAVLAALVSKVSDIAVILISGDAIDEKSKSKAETEQQQKVEAPK